MNGIVAIDGPAGSGKSSVSRAVAQGLGYVYLDTGAMYRAVALKATRDGIDFADHQGLDKLCREIDLHFRTKGGFVRLFMGEEDISAAIRSPEMDMASSAVSAVPEVRKAMTQLQRRMGEQGPLVAEGRDMGTVVFPEAAFKFFLTADAGVRAERRFRERRNRGESITLEDVTKDLEKRDRQDSSRDIAPLKAAGDAVVIDTSSMTQDEVVETILCRVRSRL
jgi:cytidylate kinase